MWYNMFIDSSTILGGTRERRENIREENMKKNNTRPARSAPSGPATSRPKKKKRKTSRTGSVEKGWKRITIGPGHPLVDRRGRAMEHRLILFTQIGSGWHKCHWCGKPVAWQRSWPKSKDALVVDHLNLDRGDNRRRTSYRPVGCATFIVGGRTSSRNHQTAREDPPLSMVLPKVLQRLRRARTSSARS